MASGMNNRPSALAMSVSIVTAILKMVFAGLVLVVLWVAVPSTHVFIVGTAALVLIIAAAIHAAQQRRTATREPQ